jgi:hypothetical protein
MPELPLRFGPPVFEMDMYPSMQLKSMTSLVDPALCPRGPRTMIGDDETTWSTRASSRVWRVWRNPRSIDLSRRIDLCELYPASTRCRRAKPDFTAMATNESVPLTSLPNADQVRHLGITAIVPVSSHPSPILCENAMLRYTLTPNWNVPSTPDWSFLCLSLLV